MAFLIKVDGNIISNSDIPESALIAPIVTLEANKTGSFTFSFPPEHPYYDSIERLHSIVEVIRDGEKIFKGVCTIMSEDIWKQRNIVCEGSLTFLNDSILRQKKYTQIPVNGLLSSYIAEHNAQVDEYKRFVPGIINVDGGLLFRYTNMQSTMQEISEDLIDNFGGYLRVRYSDDGLDKIDYLAQSPHRSSQVIELGKNLLSYDSNIDDTDFATVLIPLGCRLDDQDADAEGLEKRLDITAVNDGKDYIEASPEILAKYGRRTCVVIWDDVTVAENLLEKGRKWLTDNQFEKVYISCTAIDLSYVTSRAERISILDSIRVKSKPHGMDRDFILAKMIIDLNQPKNDVFEFGSEFKVSMTSRTNKKAAELQKAMPVESDILRMAQEQASAMIAGAEGGNIVIENDDKGQPWRILVMDTADKETARNVIQINKNGIGFSNNGVNGFYRNAWTIDGHLVADFITTGTLVGINISNGNGTFSVDEQGHLIAQNGKFGDWKIAHEGDVDKEDEGSLFADKNGYRVWLHSAGYTSWGQPRYCYAIMQNVGGGNYDTKFFADTEGNGLFAGTLYTHSSSVISSDRDLKHDIESIDINKSIDFINNLKPVKYKYNDGTSDRFHHGFIAQDLKEAMSGEDWGVYVDNDGSKGIRYEEIIADLVNTVNYLCDRIKTLEGKEN